MLQSPADKGGDMGHEGLSADSKAVLHPRRHFGINLPADETDLLQTFERLGEHLLGAIRHLTVQLIEPQRALVVQLVQHQERPLVAELVNHVPYRTVQVLRIHLPLQFSHFSISLFIYFTNLSGRKPSLHLLGSPTQTKPLAVCGGESGGNGRTR